MPINHKNLSAIKQAFARSESEMVAFIDLADSRGAWLDWRGHGRAFRYFDVKWAALIVQGGIEANNGSGDGLGNFQTGSPAPNQGLAGIPYRTFGPGSTGPNSGFVNRYPIAIAEAWVAGATSNPHFQRFTIVYSTAGFDMDSTSSGASTGGQFLRGDPALGRNVTSVQAFLITDNRVGIWLGGQLQFGFSASESNGGTQVFAAPAPGAADGTITTVTLTPTPATGTNIRARLTHVDAAPAVGTGHLLAAVRINFGSSGMVYDTWSFGGWSTSDHMVQFPAGGATENTDYKSTSAKRVEYLQKVIQAPVVIWSIECGQNMTTVQEYYEWNGTTAGAYKQNVSRIMHEKMAESIAAGCTDVYFLLRAPWRGTGDDFNRLDAARAALSELASDWDGLRMYPQLRIVAFYDQMNALVAAGHTTSNELNAALRSDPLHQNFDGNGALGDTFWDAIAAAGVSNATVRRGVLGIGVGMQGGGGGGGGGVIG